MNAHVLRRDGPMGCAISSVLTLLLFSVTLFLLDFWLYKADFPNGHMVPAAQAAGPRAPGK